MLSFPGLGQSKALSPKAPCLPWTAPGLSDSLPLAKHSCRQLPSEANREDRAGASPGTTWQLLWRGASPPDETEDETGLMTVWHSAARRLPTQSPPLPRLGCAGALGHHPGHPGGSVQLALDHGASAWEQDGGHTVNGHPRTWMLLVLKLMAQGPGHKLPELLLFG